MVRYEFPGHGDRFNEELIRSAVELADEAFTSLKDVLQGDYVLFGNSMGSLIGYLLLHKLQEAKHPFPKHFFAASRKCPASYITNHGSNELSKTEFWEMIDAYGGPKKLMQNEELKELYEPILRADYHILESYEHRQRPSLPLQASIFYGVHDRYSMEDLLSWQTHFDSSINFTPFDGDHFFVYQQPEQVLKAMLATLSDSLKV